MLAMGQNENNPSGLTWHDLRNAILFAAAIYLLGRFISYVIGTLLIFAVTALVVTILDPIIDWLYKRGIPRWIGTLALVLVGIGALTAVVEYITPLIMAQVSGFIALAPQIAEDTSEFLTRYRTRLGFGDGFSRVNLQTVWNLVSPYLGGIGQITGSFFYAVAGLLVVIVSTVYLLVNPEQIKRSFLKAWRPIYRERVAAATARLATQIRSWALGLLIGMLIVFALSWAVLELIGVPNALLFAVIAGILELVPIFGPILSAVPPTLAALVIDPFMAIWVVLAFVVIQQIESHLIMPLVMAHQVRIHPVTVTFWVLVMGALYGLLGAVLAVPAAVTAAVLYDEFYLCEIEQRCAEAEVEKTAEQKRQEEEARQEARQLNDEIGRQGTSGPRRNPEIDG